MVAQLILKHHLTVSYFPEESYPAMKGEFARILDELSKQGIHETIYLDGLDQLQPEIDGSRDLSFLPPQPPQGMVIVLGSRPDETLKPLEILHRVDYDLPPLSETDALSLWRSVQPGMADGLFHDLYTALKGNALFVHLAADTMQDASVVDATSLIKQIEQNPQNLFGITLERIKRVPLSKWDTVWKPMLALLLVAQEPLRLDVLGDLLGHDHDTMQDAVLVLGGLVSQGIDHQVALHHLLFRDYLAASVFNDRDVKRWHQELSNWCAKDVDAIWSDDRDPIEQARRVYARHHYITHLSGAENWPTLWQVLDAGDYGEQKTRFDPSTRLYALDLDRGRESVIKAGQSTEEHIQNLPRLWKYSLLRTSLTSRVDQWPDNAFEVLVILGRTQEALERIQLLSDPEQQITLWCKMLAQCDTKNYNIILNRIQQSVSQLSRHHTDTLATIAETTATSGNIDRALSITAAIENNDRTGILKKIARTAATSGDIDRALSIAATIENDNSRSYALTAIAEAIATSGNIDRALSIAATIENDNSRSYALKKIAEAIATSGDIDRALSIAATIENNDRTGILATIAETAVASGDIDRALSIAATIPDDRMRINTFITMAPVIQSAEKILSIIHKEWFQSKTHDMTLYSFCLINLLSENNLWLITTIIKSQGWVNDQLKRLG